MVKTIWSNDQVRPGPEHGDNQHHSQNQQIQQCTQHCSHVQSHYQFTLSQNITTSCYCSTTSLDRTLPTYCLAEWRPRPPSMELCVVSMELWARHMGRHCVVDKIVTFWGAEFPFFSGKKTNDGLTLSTRWENLEKFVAVTEGSNSTYKYFVLNPAWTWKCCELC